MKLYGLLFSQVFHPCNLAITLPVKTPRFMVLSPVPPFLCRDVSTSLLPYLLSEICTPAALSLSLFVLQNLSCVVSFLIARQWENNELLREKQEPSSVKTRSSFPSFASSQYHISIITPTIPLFLSKDRMVRCLSLNERIYPAIKCRPI